MDYNSNSFIAIKDFNLNLPSGFSSQHTGLSLLTDFALVSGGKIESDLQFNLNSGQYKLDFKTTALNLNVASSYIKNFMDIKDVGGEIYNDFHFSGNTNEPANVDIQGVFGIQNLFVKDSLNELASIENFAISIDSINPSRDIYALNSLHLDQSFVQYELYPDGDNISNLLHEVDTLAEGSSYDPAANLFVMIKDYAVEAMEGLKASNFSIDTVELSNIGLFYADHTLRQKFQYTVDANVDAYNVNSSSDSIEIDINALLNNKGKLKVYALLNPKKPEDISLVLNIDEMAMSDLSAYSHQYIAFPVEDGDFSMECILNIKDKKLECSNDLLIKSFTLGDKQKHKDAYNLPVKLAVSVLKDRKGHIPLNIPVNGDLADPKYKVWKAIGKIFKELILKAPSSLLNAVSGGDAESNKRISLKDLTDTLETKHYSKLDQITKTLNDKKDLALSITPHYNLQKKSELLANQWAKAEYLSLEINRTYTPTELEQIGRVDLKDSLFIQFINRKMPADSQKLSTLDKIQGLYPENQLKEQIELEVNQKQQTIFKYLLSKGISNNQLILAPTKNESSINDLQYRFSFDLAK